jgi:hypothetical protein
MASELIKEIWVVTHYDECLHGCDMDMGLAIAFGAESKCKCPIGKPFIEKESIVKRCLFESYGIPYNPEGMPRDKVLEILNEWNGKGASAGVKGHRYSKTDPLNSKKFVEVVTQYPSRWIYFIDPPSWMKTAKDENQEKFSVQYQENEAREKKELAVYGVSMKWFYHEELEDFIVPFEICSKTPHYADDISKDARVEHEYVWMGDITWTCLECKNDFVLVKNWKEWKREEADGKRY